MQPIDLNLVKGDLFQVVFLAAFFAFFLKSKSTEILLQMIIMGGIAWVAYGYLQTKSDERKDTIKDTYAHFDKIAAERKETNLDIYNISHFPKKGLTYLQKNQILVDIALDLALLKMFDRAKYGDMLVLMNQYQKTYIYILTERYYFESYFPTFLDLGEQILELMYGIYFVVPSFALKHVYNVIPYEIVEKNVNRFTVLRRKMIEILESFGKKQLKVNYIAESLPKPDDKSFDEIKIRQLP
jgi:hypothetical protein